MTYIFRRSPGRLGYRVIRGSGGAELGIVVPAPTKKWTVWAGDGKSYRNRVEAAGAMDRSAVEIPVTNREWRYGDVFVVDNRKLDRVQMEAGTDGRCRVSLAREGRRVAAAEKRGLPGVRAGNGSVLVGVFRDGR